jgi:hypothetical protein
MRISVTDAATKNVVWQTTASQKIRGKPRGEYGQIHTKDDEESSPEKVIQRNVI